MRSQAVGVVLLLLMAGAARALNTASVQAKLDAKKQQILKIKGEIESEYLKHKAAPRTLASCKAISGCGSDLPVALEPRCDSFLGLTAGCDCKGKKVVDAVAVKALDSAKDEKSQQRAANLACYAASPSVTKVYESVSGELNRDNKLMYMGSVDGAMAYYPSVLWARPKPNQCDKEYDPRLRAWFLSGSNGPKNVIFILDSSGSMNSMGRDAMLKSATSTLIDGLTSSDFVGLVDFDSEARTYLDNKFMSRATPAFRSKMKEFVSGMKPAGNTDYNKAFGRAFLMADTSYTANYHSQCQTVFVFVTDGKRSDNTPDPTDRIKKRQAGLATSKRAKEFYVIIGLGDEVSDVSDALSGGAVLKKLACDINGVFEPVPDARSATGGDMALLRALSAFSGYFQTHNAHFKREVLSFSEIYEGRNLPMLMTTATVPVYDKADASNWKMLGVVGIDVTTCDLEQELYEQNKAHFDTEVFPPDTVIAGCSCVQESWTYESQEGKVESKGCSDVEWHTRWCATDNCGIPESTVSTGHWADCKPLTARAALEELFIKSGEECSTASTPDCSIEALRPRSPNDLTCGRCASNSTLAAERASNYHQTGIPAKLSGVSKESDWATNTICKGSSCKGADWSVDMDACDQCANSNMQPACAVPTTCGKKGGGADTAPAAALIGGIVGGVVFCLGASFLLYRKRGACSTARPAQEMHGIANTQQAPPRPDRSGGIDPPPPPLHHNGGPTIVRHETSVGSVVSHESSIGQDACVVCLAARAEMACVPCGHKCLCPGCGRAETGLRTCPMCRQPVQSFMRVYG